MVGRNDPCPCGSGKKYKKCCASKQAVTVETVQMEELERVLQNFYDEYPTRKDIYEYIEAANEWKQELGQALMEEMIEAIALDEFFFHKRPDIWEDYLKKQKKKIVRPSVLQILDRWQSPRMFIGQVEAVEDEYMTVSNIFENESIKLRRESDKPIPDGIHLFSFILPDNRLKEDHYLAVSTLIFFPVDHSAQINAFANKFSAQNDKSAADFLKENTLEFWRMLVSDGYAGEEFSNFEAGVLQHVVKFLEQHDRKSEKFIEMLEDYLVEQQPNARKEVAIAAGAIRFGQEQTFFEPLSMTLKEIAEWFGVSPSSMNKYYKELSEYQMEKII